MKGGREWEGMKGGREGGRINTGIVGGSIEFQLLVYSYVQASSQLCI